MDEPRKRISKLTVAGAILGGIASVVGLYILIARAIEMVAAGRGLDTYRTTWLVEFNHVGALVLFGLIPVVLVIGGMMRLREYLQWKKLEKKYSGKKERT